ncbi:TetR/AcrR family transcriptional regulator [Streptomyces sp. NPDC088354]|uniref:TetR/AcrR family transcriptional regulator n=1 Tax=Streptomyces sp. NPDC088354 TaxID=3365856 RepID=UPI003822D76F
MSAPPVAPLAPSEATVPAGAPPRERILATASRLFYAEGIHAVGMDRIVTEAATTRATLYRHFTGKEQLVLSYIQTTDRQIRAYTEGALHGLGAREALLGVAGALGDQLCAPGFRGCPFLNAAAEYPDPADPVTRAIVAHRTWLRELVERLLAEAGAPEPAEDAATLMMLRDGAAMTAALSDPQTVRAALDRALRKVLEAAGVV